MNIESRVFPTLRLRVSQTMTRRSLRLQLDIRGRPARAGAAGPRRRRARAGRGYRAAGANFSESLSDSLGVSELERLETRYS